MKRVSGTAFAVIAAAFVMAFTGCASSPKSEEKVTINEDTTAKTTVVTDWANRNLDEVAKPEWLKKLIRGNSTVFATEYNVGADQIIKYSVGIAKTRDASLAASRVNYNAMRAEELKTKVVSEAAATLNNDGYIEATSNAATLAKVDLSGHELVTQFWQEVKTTDKAAGTEKTEYLCYSVYKISKEAWVNTLKGFLAQVIPAIPDNEAQVKMAKTIQSLYDDTAKEQEKSEEETKAALNAQIEMARIDADKEVAKAKASQPVVVQQAASQKAESGINWKDALELAADVIF